MHTFFCCCCKQSASDPQLLEGLLTPVPVDFASETVQPETIEPEIDEAAGSPRSATSPIQTSLVSELSMLSPPPPPNSPNTYRKNYATTEYKLNKLMDYFLTKTRSPVTSFNFLRISNFIIDPLREGNYNLASLNFCTLYEQEPICFHRICKKIGILTEDIYLEKPRAASF
jgi:hypothetical protein